MELLLRVDHLLMDLTNDQHNEGEALFLVVVLELQVVEISAVFNVLIKRFNPPAFLVGFKHFLR